VLQQPTEVSRNHSLPVNFSALPQLFVDIEAIGLAAKGLVVKDPGLRIRIQVAARVAVAADPVTETFSECPPRLRPIGNEPGRIALAVPVRFSC
jgi:hypothetical protein